MGLVLTEAIWLSRKRYDIAAAVDGVMKGYLFGIEQGCGTQWRR
jgi:hypothetical protein